MKIYLKTLLATLFIASSTVPVPPPDPDQPWPLKLQEECAQQMPKLIEAIRKGDDAEVQRLAAILEKITGGGFYGMYLRSKDRKSFLNTNWDIETGEHNTAQIGYVGPAYAAILNAVLTGTTSFADPKKIVKTIKPLITTLASLDEYAEIYRRLSAFAEGMAEPQSPFAFFAEKLFEKSNPTDAGAQRLFILANLLKPLINSGKQNDENFAQKYKAALERIKFLTAKPIPF